MNCLLVLWVFEEAVEVPLHVLNHFGEHRGHCFDQAEQTALHVLVVVSQQFVNVLVEVQVNRNCEPVLVVFKQKQVGQQ